MNSEKNLTKKPNQKLEQTGIAGIAEQENSVTARNAGCNTSATPLESTIPWQFNDREDSDHNRELQIGDRVIVKSKKVKAKVIGQDVESGLYEIAYSDSESSIWEGSANLTLTGHQSKCPITLASSHWKLIIHDYCIIQLKFPTLLLLYNRQSPICW